MFPQSTAGCRELYIPGKQLPTAWRLTSANNPADTACTYAFTIKPDWFILKNIADSFLESGDIFILIIIKNLCYHGDFGVQSSHYKAAML
jgi:hypothetical protein